MKIIEIPDNKECEDLVDDSIQLISKIMPNSILKNLRAPKTICKNILLEIIHKII